MKEQVTDLEKIPADQMTDKRLVCKLYTENGNQMFTATCS